VHKHADWLAGSPDGLIGTEGIVEAKCPYWSKTPHQTIPLYYYLQINLCLECADREWCDFISWTPGAYKVIRVTRDRDLHGVLTSTHYAQFYRAMCDGDGPPKFAKGEKEMIREMVEESRNAHMDTGFWDRVETRALPPTLEDFPDLE